VGSSPGVHGGPSARMLRCQRTDAFPLTDRSSTLIVRSGTQRSSGMQSKTSSVVCGAGSHLDDDFIALTDGQQHVAVAAPTQRIPADANQPLSSKPARGRVVVYLSAVRTSREVRRSRAR
jgi:hypothetical protein